MGKNKSRKRRSTSAAQKQNLQTISSKPDEYHKHAVAIKHDLRHVMVDGMTSPEALDAYKERHPDFYETISTQFPKQLEHNREMQKMALEGDLNVQRLGQAAAIVLFALVIGLAALMVVMGYPWTAAVMVMVAFGALFGIKMLNVSVEPKIEHGEAKDDLRTNGRRR